MTKNTKLRLSQLMFFISGDHKNRYSPTFFDLVSSNFQDMIKIVTEAYSRDRFLNFFEMQVMHNTVHFCAKMYRIVHNLHFEKNKK